MDELHFLLACSGPGAGRKIAWSIAIGFICFVFAAFVVKQLLFLFECRGAKRWPVYWGFGLLSFHPAWSVSAIHGDCGIIKVIASLVVSIVLTVLLVIQKYAARK